MCHVVAVVLSLLAVAPASAAPPGSTLLASRPDGTGPVPPAFDNDSTTPGAISRDGRYALFLSDADGFAPGTDSRPQNLFLRDTVTNTTTLVSRSDGFDGAGANAASDDGDLAVANIGGVPHVLVVFATVATNLVDNATGATVGPTVTQRIWMRDVTAGRTTLISRADGSTGSPANDRSSDPSIAVGNTGPVVAFRSSANNLDGTGSGGVYLRRVSFEDTQLVSCKNNTCAGTPAAASAGPPDVTTVASAGGTYCPAPLGVECTAVAFAAVDTTMTNDPTGTQQIMFAVVRAGAPTTFYIASRPPAPSTALGNGMSSLSRVERRRPGDCVSVAGLEPHRRCASARRPRSGVRAHRQHRRHDPGQSSGGCCGLADPFNRPRRQLESASSRLPHRCDEPRWHATPGLPP